MTEPPTADPCDRCGREMEVLRYEDDGTILWQECEDCEVGWSPELGFHELGEIEIPDDSKERLRCLIWRNRRRRLETIFPDRETLPATVWTLEFVKYCWDCFFLRFYPKFLLKRRVSRLSPPRRGELR